MASRKRGRLPNAEGMTVSELYTHLGRFKSKSAFARALGVWSGSLQTWLRGQVNISPKMAARIRALCPDRGPRA